MEYVDTLFTHGLIVTQDEQRTIIADGALAVRDGRILAVGSTEELNAQTTALETINLKGDALFPGLINTHTHLFQTGVKGLGEDMPVQEWVHAVTAPTAAHINPEEAYLFALTGCLEHIHCGVTTLVDMSYAVTSMDVHDRYIAAILESGLRGRYSSIISDYGDFGIPSQLLKPIDTFLAETTELLAEYPGDDRMGIWLAIGAPWVATDEAIRNTRTFATNTGTFLTMHLNENRIDNDLMQQRHGLDAIPYLEKIGFLGPDFLAIHCVVMSEEEIELLARRDVKVSYNPVSNMYLGSGIAPMVRMAEAGITISIGVDGAGSNNSQDMIESLKMAALLQKVGHEDAAVIDAQTVLDWATRDAAIVMGMSDKIGSLETGKKADMFVLSRNSAKIVPAHDPVSTLVYSSGQENVSLTMVDGHILMRDNQIQHLDEGDILQRSQTTALDLANRCQSNQKVTRHWR